MTNYYIITGASKGLGAELARQLLSHENEVFCLSRTEDAEINFFAQKHGYRYHFCSVDLSQVNEVIVAFNKLFKPIATSNVTSITLINNAANVLPIKDIQHCTDEEILYNIQLNYITPTLLTSNFIRCTAGLGGVRKVINISSGSAKYPARSMSLYCSTKAALNMFTECVRMEQLGESNPVQMFAIDPGMMDTDMQETARNSIFELSAYFLKMKEEGNLAKPSDAASRILTIIRTVI